MKRGVQCEQGGDCQRRALNWCVTFQHLFTNRLMTMNDDNDDNLILCDVSSHRLSSARSSNALDGNQHIKKLDVTRKGLWMLEI